MVRGLRGAFAQSFDGLADPRGDVDPHPLGLGAGSSHAAPETNRCAELFLDELELGFCSLDSACVMAGRGVVETKPEITGSGAICGDRGGVEPLAGVAQCRL